MNNTLRLINKTLGLIYLVICSIALFVAWIANIGFSELFIFCLVLGGIIKMGLGE